MIARNRTSRALILGVGIMSALFGWIAYAADNPLQSLMNGGQTSGSSSGSSSDATKLMGQISTMVEAAENQAINTEMFGGTDITPADAMITNHFGNYCITSSESGNCSANPFLQFGDIKLSSILSASQYSDDAATQAANVFFGNLFNAPGTPNVTNFQSKVPMSAATVTADPELKKSFTEALSEETTLSVARLPFLEAIAKRTPRQTDQGPGLSEMAEIEQVAIKRFMNPDWVKNLSSLKIEAIAQEQAVMQAYQLWLDYQRYRQMERVETLLGVMILQNFRQGKALAAAAKQPTQSDVSGAVQSTGGASGTGGETGQ